MTSYISKISNIPIPFIIPRRGKGSYEVNALCTFNSYGYYKGINYISYLSPYARGICDSRLPVVLAETIKENSNINKLDFSVEFDYYI